MDIEIVARAVAGELRKRVPGVAAVIATSDEVLFARGWGAGDLGSGTDMTESSICNWFSMTKPVTATAIVQLCEDGLMSLDQPVVELYEPFELLQPVEASRKVTVRHLLSHSSGVANPFPLRWTHREDEEGPDVSTFVEGLLRKHNKLRFEPGAKAAYTNLGYLVLGEIVGRVAAIDYRDYVTARILGPLGMRSTAFTSTDPSRRAIPYQRRSSPLGIALPLLIPRRLIGPRRGSFRAIEPLLVDGPAYGGLVGSAEDAARFMRCHLGGGQLEGARILSEDGARAMRRVVSRGSPRDMGLGWFQPTKSDRSFFEHLGGGVGFWNCMRLYENGLGVLLMGNSTAWNHGVVATAAERASRDGA